MKLCISENELFNQNFRDEYQKEGQLLIRNFQNLNIPWGFPFAKNSRTFKMEVNSPEISQESFKEIQKL